MQQIKYIGVIRSELRSLDNCPKLETEDAPGATLIILPEYLEGLKNIKAGDELLILTWLHLADRSVLSCHPRDDKSKPIRGVFSTRSADRPNPVGLHKVKVIAVPETGELKLNHIEVLDGTPVVDIKPVL